jgi:hypothetical protein
MRSGLLAALALVLFPWAAYACRCADEPGPAAAYKRADAVLLGEVLQVEPTGEAGEQAALVKVERAWKSGAESEQRVYTRTTCAYPFATGTRVVLHVFRDARRQRLETRQCMGNQPADQAEKRILWLQRHGRPAAVPPNRVP